MFKYVSISISMFSKKDICSNPDAEKANGSSEVSNFEHFPTLAPPSSRKKRGAASTMTSTSLVEGSPRLIATRQKKRAAAFRFEWGLGMAEVRFWDPWNLIWISVHCVLQINPFHVPMFLGNQIM